MPRIRVLTAVAGDPSWSAGEVVTVDEATAAAWADGERAELVDDAWMSPEELRELDATQRPRKTRPRGERAVAPPAGEVR